MIRITALLLGIALVSSSAWAQQIALQHPTNDPAPQAQYQSLPPALNAARYFKAPYRNWTGPNGMFPPPELGRDADRVAAAYRGPPYPPVTGFAVARQKAR